MHISILGLPLRLTGKESTGNTGNLGPIPGLGRSPGEGKGYPLQYSGLENSMDSMVHGVTKSQTWLTDFHFHFSLPVPGTEHWTLFCLFLFLKGFQHGPFLKSLLNLFQDCFMFCFFGPKACSIPAPQPGIKSTPPQLEEVLTTGPPAKSLNIALWIG